MAQKATDEFFSEKTLREPGETLARFAVKSGSQMAQKRTDQVVLTEVG